jgi:hypothetical protein
MKELGIISAKKDKKETVKQQKQVQELQYVDTIHPHENHILFKIDLKTLKVSKATIKENENYRLNWNWKKSDGIPKHREVIIEPGFAYVSALTPQTAVKKFKENKNGSKRNKNNQYL